jgi:hypothetical protein
MMLFVQDICITCDISLDFTEVCSGDGNSDCIFHS